MILDAILELATVILVLFVIPGLLWLVFDAVVE